MVVEILNNASYFRFNELRNLGGRKESCYNSEQLCSLNSLDHYSYVYYSSRLLSYSTKPHGKAPVSSERRFVPIHHSSDPAHSFSVTSTLSP